MVEDSEPGELLDTLNTFFSGFDRILAKHKVLKVKTIGDCYMCVGGIPGQQKTHTHEVCSRHWTCSASWKAPTFSMNLWTTRGGN